ncbi:hypothetical protein [uncultured Roseobacter sp.]|uniref:hypothetical protein n=1 Tax=uncultured Roseobacter sp. TaxID=114847 RepID=UPI0026249CEE|nr:hypothetical protein [uncultured Roseobacter sp.]
MFRSVDENDLQAKIEDLSIVDVAPRTRAPDGGVPEEENPLGGLNLSGKDEFVF